MSTDLLARELRLILQAKSAITQCCLALGASRTGRILLELGGVEHEIRDRLDVEKGSPCS